MVVESELDGLLVISQAGAVAGCLILGSAGNKPGDRAYHTLKQSLRILDALDYDQAGAGAGKWWRQEFDQVKRWPVPVGKDPGEAFEAGVDILAWVTEGLPPALTMAFRQTEIPRPEIEPVEIPSLEPASLAAELPATDNEPMVAPTVAELKCLLEKYPVKIRATEDRISLICAPAWHNGDIKQTISQLIYFDLDVAEYLDAHPATMVHRGNFIFERRNER